MNQAEKGELTTFPENELVQSGTIGSMTSYNARGSPLRSAKNFIRSSSLLKGFATLFGLWVDRHRFRVVLALVFLIPDTYNLIQSVAYVFVCPHLQKTVDTWFCGNETRNMSSSDVHINGLQFPIRKIDLLDFVLKLAQPISHSAFLWSVWKSTRKDEVIRQSHTSVLVKPEQWLKLNCMIFLFFFAMLTSLVWHIISNLAGPPGYLVSSTIYAISLWASLLTCWIFGAYTSSLETMTSRLISDVITSDDLDDIIALHQKLCKKIFATADAFKIWFMIHWALYNGFCVVWIANVVFYYNIFSQSPSTLLRGTVHLFIYVYVFIYPCYCAASVTAKCRQMLTDFNMKYTKYEWSETHPFRQRQQLHLFLKYASYANCGYKVGSITFSSMSVFFSTVLATIGVGLKIFN